MAFKGFENMKSSIHVLDYDNFSDLKAQGILQCLGWALKDKYKAIDKQIFVYVCYFQSPIGTAAGLLSVCF